MEERIDVLLCSFLGGAGLGAVIARGILREVIAFFVKKYFPDRYFESEKSVKVEATKSKGDENASRD